MSQPAVDPTSYRTAAAANAAAPREELASVVVFDRAAERNDARTVVDVNPATASYETVVGWAHQIRLWGGHACSDSYCYC